MRTLPVVIESPSDIDCEEINTRLTAELAKARVNEAAVISVVTLERRVTAEQRHRLALAVIVNTDQPIDAEFTITQEEAPPHPRCTHPGCWQPARWRIQDGDLMATLCADHLAAAPQDLDSPEVKIWHMPGSATERSSPADELDAVKARKRELAQAAKRQSPGAFSRSFAEAPPLADILELCVSLLSERGWVKPEVIRAVRAHMIQAKLGAYGEDAKAAGSKA